jgi:hypothetical protein
MSNHASLRTTCGTVTSMPLIPGLLLSSMELAAP